MLNTDLLLVKEYKQGFNKYSDTTRQILLPQELKEQQPGSHSGQWHPHFTQRGKADRAWFSISSQVMVMGGTDTPDKVLTIFPSSQHYFNCHETSSWYKSTDFLRTTWGHRESYLNWRMAGTPEDWKVTHWGKTWVWNYLTEVAARNSGGSGTALASRSICLCLCSFH